MSFLPVIKIPVVKNKKGIIVMHGGFDSFIEEWYFMMKYLTGRNDHFVPFKMHDLQLKALINARSVTDIVFTKESHAQNHCQIGNIGLALDAMVEWIGKKSKS